MVDSYCLYYHYIERVHLEKLNEHFNVYSVLEFPNMVEVIIKKPFNFSKFDLKMKFLILNLPLPYEIYRINSRSNQYIYPSNPINTKCIRIYNK